MDPFLQAAIEEAKKGLAEGGIPIGSVLVLDGNIIGRGHNQRVQRGSVIHHAEMNCLENAGRLRLRFTSAAFFIRRFHPVRCAAAQCCFTKSRASSSAKTKLFKARKNTSARKA